MQIVLILETIFLKSSMEMSCPKPVVFVELFNPFRSYLAGDTVKGRVVIQNGEKAKARELIVSLHGNGRVGRWKKAKKDSIPTEFVTYTSEAYISRSVKLLQNESGHLGTITVGYSYHPFEFPLPEDLPSSYKSKNGIISYILTAKLAMENSDLDNSFELPFTVNALCDLNTQYGVLESQMSKNAKAPRLSYRGGIVSVILRLQRSGFVPGEILQFSCEITNWSHRGVQDVEATLYQDNCYHPNVFKEWRRSTAVASMVLKDADDSMTRGRLLWTPNELKVPSVPPTNSTLNYCKIIKIKYRLRLQVNFTGVTRSLRTEVPVIIGTIPLRSTFEQIERPVASAPAEALVLPQSGMASDANPPAYEMLIEEYPDLPPPTYEEALTLDDVSEDQSDGESGSMGSLAESADEQSDEYPIHVSPSWAEYVPNYLSFDFSRMGFEPDS